MIGRFSAVLARFIRPAPARTADELSAAPVHTGPDPTAGIASEYRALLDHCGAAVLVLSGSGQIQTVNSTACSVFGAPESSLVSRTILEASFCRDLHRLIDAARESGLEQSGHVRLPRGTDLEVWAAPIAREGRGDGRIIVVGRDVTELRRLETVRRDFVANVSHELRTPLTSIRAMAETLQDGALEDSAVSEQFLATIVSEADRLTRISQDLLVLSRAESSAPELTPIDLADLVAGTVDRFATQAARGGITLSTAVKGPIPVLGSHDQLQQVVVNLVDNAIQYTPAGGKVTVATEMADGAARVTVTDTGIGVMEGDLPRLFERFYRVDRARSRASGGTGLGLSIVKHIVESHGGEVRVRSEYNKGSVFEFTLPSA